MNTHLPISVIVPVFNEEKAIAACLTSLTKQTVAPSEIIVIDNNCTDNTIDIARQFGVRIVKEKKQGMIPARECGIAAARSPVIARADADSIYEKDWIAIIEHAFVTNTSLVAITGNFSAFPDAHWIVAPFLRVFVWAIYYPITTLLMGHLPLVGPNHAILKRTWEKTHVHTDDQLVHEDIDLSCHLAPLGTIAYVSAMRASYSLRRWKKNFWGTWWEYFLRYLRTIWIHHPFFLHHR